MQNKQDRISQPLSRVIGDGTPLTPEERAEIEATALPGPFPAIFGQEIDSARTSFGDEVLTLATLNGEDPAAFRWCTKRRLWVPCSGAREVLPLRAAVMGLLAALAAAEAQAAHFEHAATMLRNDMVTSLRHAEARAEAAETKLRAVLAAAARGDFVAGGEP